MVVCLLAGSVGFGKDLCLELMADQLCVNRLEFDCHELWSVDGKSTEGNLNSFFEKGKLVTSWFMFFSSFSV